MLVEINKGKTMTKSCANCGECEEMPKKGSGHYNCPQIFTGNITVQQLWALVKHGNKPHECDIWKLEDEH